jgi:hypothetical protein
VFLACLLQHKPSSSWIQIQIGTLFIFFLKVPFVICKQTSIF